MTRRELAGMREDFLRYSIKDFVKHFIFAKAKRTTNLKCKQWNGKNILEVGRFVDEWVYGYYDQDGEYEYGSDAKLEIQEDVLNITLAIPHYAVQERFTVPKGGIVKKATKKIKGLHTYHWIEIVCPEH